MTTDIDEDALFNELRKLPDFDCFPLPARWYKKYNIPPLEQPNTREFLNSHYTIKCATAPKDLPPLIINEPQQGGKLVPVAPPPDIEVKTIQRPLEVDQFVVHPMLMNDEVLGITNGDKTQPQVQQQD